MAIRALVLSGDEKAVLAVTQILDELEIAFEHSTETTFGIKRLANQRFDLILIDCDNEQNATLIFNCIRGSALNKVVIAIAIVDGRGGVPTAFRLGASLVVTKAVALEQARSTLRTALGMLRKETEVRTTVTPAVTANAATSDRAEDLLTDRYAVPQPAPDGDHEKQAEATISDGSSPQLPAPNSGCDVEPALPTAAAVSERPTTADTPTVDTGTKVVPFQARSQRKESAMARGQEAAPPAPIPIKPALLQSFDSVAPETGKGSAKRVSDENMSRARKSPARGNRVLALTAVSAVLVGAAIWVAWTTQPKFRELLAYEYVQLKLQIAGLRLQELSLPSTKQIPAHPLPQAAPSELPPSQTAQASSTELTQPGATDATATNVAAPNVAAPNVAGPNVAAPEEASAADSGPARLNPPQPVKTTDEGSVSKASHSVVKDSALTEGVRSSPSSSSHNLKHTVAAGKSAGGTLLATSSTQKAPTKAGEPLVLSEDVADDSVVRRVRPVYPKLARQKKAHGPVLLRVVVDKEGRVDTVQVLEGSTLLAQSAVDAVKQWRYRPYLHRGEAVVFQTKVSVDFLP